MKLQMANRRVLVQSPVFRAAQPTVSSRADDDHSCGSRHELGAGANRATQGKNTQPHGPARRHGILAVKKIYRRVLFLEQREGVRSGELFVGDFGGRWLRSSKQMH
jgi:hypothetical protein